MSQAPECKIFSRVLVSGIVALQCKDDNRRLSVKFAIYEIASQYTIEWQSQLRVKLAICGIASELILIKMKACE